MIDLQFQKQPLSSSKKVAMATEENLELPSCHDVYIEEMLNLDAAKNVWFGGKYGIKPSNNYKGIGTILVDVTKKLVMSKNDNSKYSGRLSFSPADDHLAKVYRQHGAETLRGMLYHQMFQLWQGDETNMRPHEAPL